ncbi:MAG: hypothetical protein QM728_03755 [Gordonia sp. (in: high G+C Gram-positive bacteria)]|uniref:hypothetical protein n=1 Tax=Gordonia sp. (in: high G+C Gram-positive bacteria) TaxID=84139 RepID=UPI0039E4C3A9
MLLAVFIAAVVGEALFLLLRDTNGLDYRAREFSAALHDREVRHDREVKAARRALQAGPRHRVA